ncbi:proteoglycan 4 isoform X2 [Rana temporaria]|uniref:proteoglycan 4 isoform X2 n=1 Tax=Rana temporaria TaxID=8407 RepID=UPI001AAE139E|nr:proteoglycan 4 isoform X2 [Rana temporaria]
MDISVTLLTSTPAATFNKESTKPAHNYESTIEQQDMETKAKSTQDSLNNPVNMDMTTPYPGTNNGEKVEIDIGNTVKSGTNSKVTTVTISPSHFDTDEKLNKEMITYSSTTKKTTEQPPASTDQILLLTSHQSNGVFSESIFKTTKNAYVNEASFATGSTEKAYSLHDEADNVNTIFPAGTAKVETNNESKTTVPFSDKQTVSVDTTSVGTDSASTTQLAQTSIIMATDTNSKDSYSISFRTEAKAFGITTETPKIDQAVSTLHTTQAPLKDSTNTPRSMDTTKKETIPQSTTVTEVTNTKEERLPTTDDNRNVFRILTTAFTNLVYSTTPGEDKSVPNIFAIQQTSAKMDTIYATLTEKQHSTHITLTEQTTTLSTPSLQPTNEQSTQQPPDTTLIKESSSKSIKNVAFTEKIPYTVTTSSTHKSSSESETSTLRQTPDTLHMTTDDLLIKKETNTEHLDISSVTTKDKIREWQTTDNTNKVSSTSTIQENLTTLKEITESKSENPVSSISVQNTRETTEATDKVQSPTTAEGKLLSAIPSDATERNNQNIVTQINKISTDTPTEVNSVMVATEKASNNADYVAVPGETVNELLPNSTSSTTSIESTTDKLQTTLQPKVEMTKVLPVNEVTDVKEATTKFSQATLYTTLSIDHKTDLSTGESNDVTNAISTAEIIKEHTDPAKPNGITTQQSAEKKHAVSQTTMYRLDLQTSQIQSTTLPLNMTSDSKTGLNPVTAEMLTNPSLITTDSSQKSVLTSETSTSRQTINLPETSQMPTTYHSDMSSTTAIDILKARHTTENINADQFPSTIQGKLLTSKDITESEIIKTVTPTSKISTDVPSGKEFTEREIYNTVTPTAKMTTEVPVEKEVTENQIYNTVMPTTKMSTEVPVEKEKVTENEIYNTVMPTTKMSTEVPAQKEKVTENEMYNTVMPTTKMSTEVPVKKKVTENEIYNTIMPTTKTSTAGPAQKEKVTENEIYNTIMPTTKMSTEVPVENEKVTENEIYNTVMPTTKMSTEVPAQKEKVTENEIYNTVMPTTKMSTEVPVEKVTENEIYNTVMPTTKTSTEVPAQKEKVTENEIYNTIMPTTKMSTEVPVEKEVTENEIYNTVMPTTKMSTEVPAQKEKVTENEIYNTVMPATKMSTEVPVEKVTENEIYNTVMPTTEMSTDVPVEKEKVTENEIYNTVTPKTKMSTEVPVEKEVTENEIFNTVMPTTKMSTEVPVEKDKVTENEIYNTVMPTTKMSTEVPVEKEFTENGIYNTVMPTTKMSTEVPVEKDKVTENEIYNTVMPTTKMSTEVPVEKEVTENEIYNTVMPTAKMSTEVPVEKDKVTENEIYNTVMPTTKMSTEVPVEKEVTENEIYNTVMPTAKMRTEVPVEKEKVTENKIYNKVTSTTKMSTEVPVEKKEVTENEIYNTPTTKMSTEVPVEKEVTENEIYNKVTPTTKMSTEVPVEKEEVTENEIHNKVTPTTKMSTEVPVESSTIFVAKETATHNIDSIAVTKETSVSTLKTPQDQSTADSNAKHTTPKLEGTAVTTPRLEGTAVTTPGLEGTAVTTSRLEGTAVTTSRLEGTAVTTSRLEGTAVTTPGLKGTAVTTSRLDGSAVTTPGLEGTAVQHKSTPKGPTKHTPGSGLTTTSSHSSPGKDSGTSPKTQTMDRSTNKMDEYSTTAPFTTRNPNESKSQTSTNPTTRHADDIITKDTAETTTTGQSVKLTTRQPDMDQTTKQPGQRPIPGEGSSYEATTKQSPNAKTTSIPRRTTTAPNQKDSFTTMPINKDDIETNKTTTPHTIHPHHICNLLKDEAISLRIPESDLKLITEICAEMQQQYPNINIPSLQTRQPNIDKRKIHPEYPLSEGTPNFWYQPPGSKLIQIIEEIYRRIYISPTTNLTGIPGQDNHRSTAWLLLINKIKRAIDPQMNLCVGPPADGMTTLQNGSMVVFRGHYFWTLNQGGATEMPRKISEVWGIPSPIDTVFTRCNCGGKTFFFKGPRYWRFTNDAMDKGYPKEIIKGFGGLGGKVTAVLSVSGIKTRPESVYFFKPGGNVQKYTFRQEQTKRCTKKKQPSVNYPIYSQRVQTVKFRFPRDIVRHRIEIRRTFTNIPQPLGILHKERSVRSTWRGIPSNIVSAVSLPNPQKQDGFDYFVFTKDKYYNINMSSKVAMKPPAEAEQKTTKDFYKCKE